MFDGWLLQGKERPAVEENGIFIGYMEMFEYNEHYLLLFVSSLRKQGRVSNRS